ncbi:MAG: class I SAM-dependent methyltransferase [Clostridia bacterium]|nr:class I SAM-dependent methyltransferase [Clostridia bacterium]
MFYDLIAPFYDEINGSLDYSAWADFIEKIVKKEYSGTPELWLDLGCGTGRMTLELAKRGYDMTGVDSSPEMLDAARDAAERAGLSDRMLWLCQDMREFELYGTVDVTVSCLDCVNHLVSSSDLGRCFSLVHNYLSPDGLFIFDVNGKYKFENIYADRSYVMEEDGALCIWQNDYNGRTKICDFYITLMTECDDGRYERFDDVGRERMYTLASLKRALGECGFEFVGAYSDFEFNAATDASERIYIVARCKKNT